MAERSVIVPDMKNLHSNDAKAFLVAIWRRAPWRVEQAPLPIACLLIAVVWGVVFYFCTLLDNTKRQDARQDVSNLARVYEEHVARAVRETDKTLLFLRAIYEADPASFNLARWVNDTEFKSELLVQFAFIDASGIMIESNVGKANRKIDLSDREHFKVQVDATSDTLFISKPMLGRVSGKWSVQLSRRIRSPGGKFAGVLVGSIDPAFLASFYDGIDLGANGATTLVGLDGTIRARGGLETGPLSRSLASSKVFALTKTHAHGFFTESDPVDGVSRLIGYRLVRDFPLIVMVGMSEAEITGQSQLNRTVGLLIGTSLTVLIILLIQAMSRKSDLNAKIAALAAERDKSDDANKAKSTFLAIMSHEIRTPLNAILGLSGSLLEKRLPKAEHDLIKVINEEGDRLLVILNDILDYSKMEAGKLTLEPTTFDPVEIGSSVLSIFGPRGSAKGLAMEYITGSTMPAVVVGDAGRMRQVLLNVVSNSIKFTPSGKVAVQVRSMAHKDGLAKIEWCVTDTGIGIEPEHIGALFGDFVQADGSINRSFGGSGLGLSISRRILRQMGGDIEISSRPGHGTVVRFWVELPVGNLQPVATSDIGATRTKLQSLAAAKNRKLRVLVVDDSPTNLLVASQMLEEVDFAVETAGDGCEAVTSATRFDYDIILMDMRMPEMDGLEATRILRARGSPQASVPIIAFTANAFAEDIKSCTEAGMVGFVTKPVRKDALLIEMVRVLERAVYTPSAAATQISNSATVSGLAAPFDQTTVCELVDALGVARTREAVGQFTSEAASRLSELRTLVEHRDEVKVAREAHSLKGISATFGLRELSELAAHLERQATIISPGELAAYISQLEAAFWRAQSSLDRCEALAA